MIEIDARLARAIDDILDRPRYRDARFGISVVRLEDGSAVFERDANRLFQAASTTKLLTVASALRALGPDYRFRTLIRRCGSLNGDGVLDGDLVLVGSGDPNLSNRVRPDGTLAFKDIDHSLGGFAGAEAVEGDPLSVIRDLARKVRSRGILRVRGSVRVDTRLFREGEREMGTSAVISPVVVNDNLIDLHVTAGEQPGDPVQITVSPQCGYVSFIVDAVTGTADSTPSLQTSPEERSSDGNRVVRISGALPPRHCGLYKHPVAAPSRFARIALLEALAECGVVVEGGPLGNDIWGGDRAGTDCDTVAVHVSPPLYEAAKVVNKVSQNLHAEIFTRVVGAHARNAQGSEAEAAGFCAERQFLEDQNLDLTSAIQGDSCGALGHFTPRFMSSFVQRMSTLSIYDAFYQSLPVLGRDGTLHDVAAGSPAAGNVRAKTGTMGVEDKLGARFLVSSKALAGYATAASGADVAFAAFINQLPAAGIDGMFEAGNVLGDVASAIYACL